MDKKMVSGGTLVYFLSFFVCIGIIKEDLGSGVVGGHKRDGTLDPELHKAL